MVNLVGEFIHVIVCDFIYLSTTINTTAFKLMCVYWVDRTVFQEHNTINPISAAKCRQLCTARHHCYEQFWESYIHSKHSSHFIGTWDILRRKEPIKEIMFSKFSFFIITFVYCRYMYLRLRKQTHKSTTQLRQKSLQYEGGINPNPFVKTICTIWYLMKLIIVG